MPWLILSDESDDPVKTVETLLDAGAWQPIEGGWLVTPRGDERTGNAARQARFRAKKRNARVTRVSNARNAPEDENSEQFSGDYHSHSAPLGPVSESDPRESNAALRVTRNADETVTRNARNADPAHPSIAQLAEDMRLSDEDRDRGRAGARAALERHFGRGPE